MRFRGLFLSAASALSIGSQAQLVVDQSMTPEQLVQNVLLGGGVSISNITFNGGVATDLEEQAGSFQAPAISNLGLVSGVILSTGSVATTDPANFEFGADGAAEDFASSQMMGSSDADLEQLSGQEIHDVSILEFDFVPTGDSLKFRYVFGSEEYPSFTCSDYNDAFGFFLSGPGFAGPFSNGAVNIALVPGTNVPVSINTLNSGVSSTGDETDCVAADPNWQSNSQYFVDNASQTGTIVTYDGFTVVLTAFALVQCGEQYHIKLAIGDGFDESLDSGVFLEAGSFSSEPFIPTLQPSAGVIGNVMLESCFPYTMGFVRIACDVSTPQTVYMSYGGTAEMGVDVEPAMPDSLVFGPGVEVVNVDFSVPIDADELESMEITTHTIDCEGLPTSHTFSFGIGQTDELVVEEVVEVVACGESVNFAPVVSGGFGQYTYQWSNGGQDPSATITPTQAETLELTVLDLCDLTASGTQQVTLSAPPNFNMSVFGSSQLREGCDDGTINFIRPQSMQGPYTITLQSSGSATPGADYTVPGQVVIPSGVLSTQQQVIVLEDDEVEDDEVVTITGTVTNACAQSVTATVNMEILNVDAFSASLPALVAECSEDSLELVPAVDGGVAPYQYLWADESTTSSLWVMLQNDGAYPVTVTDACGRVAQASGSVQIECAVIIPNVFSPNNDGQNDRWVIGGLGTRPNTVKLFNRWGKMVLDAKNYRNNFAAQDVPDGTYFYEIVVEGKEKPFTGHLTILRN